MTLSWPPLGVTTTKLSGSEWDGILKQLFSAWMSNWQFNESFQHLLTHSVSQQLFQQSWWQNMLLVIAFQTDRLEHVLMWCSKPSNLLYDNWMISYYIKWPLSAAFILNIVLGLGTKMTWLWLRDGNDSWAYFQCFKNDLINNDSWWETGCD